MNLTEEIAAFATSLQFDAIPPEVVETVKMGFADTVGVMLSGGRLPVANIAYRFASGRAGQLPDPLLGKLGLTPPQTALVYATAAHAEDFDDTGINGHPSAVLVPALLAEAETSGADGRRMLAAYMVGYEVWAELAAREPRQHHEKGWHPSPVFGVVAATAAIVNMRRLGPGLARNALGIAASSAAGLVSNFGSMTKPFQLARAAQFALEAVELAAAGLTAGADAIGHELGFLKAFSPAGEADISRPCELGRHWRFLDDGISIKLYPMCYATHRAIEATFQLMEANGLGAENIEGFEIEIGRTQAAILKYDRPVTVAEARFSAQFAVAVAAATGRCGLEEVKQETVSRPDIQRLIQASRVIAIEERDPDYVVFSPFDRVTALLKDGRRIASSPVRRSRGHPARNLAREDLWQKFAETAGPSLGQEAARALFERIFAMEGVAHVSSIYRMPAQPDASEASADTLPLKGLVVVELGTSVAGPVASMILGELGAEVIKIENPRGGDDARSWGPPFLGNAAAMFQAINRGKRSVAVDFKDPRQLDDIKSFIARHADIVVQNMRPGLASRYGLDHAGLAERNPRLIYCNLTAFGAGGPLSHLPGYDPLLQAFGGIMSVTGHEDAEPVRVGPSILDQGAGMWSAIAVLAALEKRRRTGRGCEIDTSLFETALSWLCMHSAQFQGSGRVPRRMGSEHGGMVPYKAYRAEDGWIVIAAANDNLFRRFAHALGRPDWAEQPEYASNSSRIENRGPLNEEIAAVIATRPRQHWIDALQGVQVPCAAIQNLQEVLEHAQTAAVGMMQASPDRTMVLMGLPIRFDGIRPPFRAAPPELGADTEHYFGLDLTVREAEGASAMIGDSQA